MTLEPILPPFSPETRGKNFLLLGHGFFLRCTSSMLKNDRAGTDRAP